MQIDRLVFPLFPLFMAVYTNFVDLSGSDASRFLTEGWLEVRRWMSLFMDQRCFF